MKKTPNTMNAAKGLSGKTCTPKMPAKTNEVNSIPPEVQAVADEANRLIDGDAFLSAALRGGAQIHWVDEGDAFSFIVEFHPGGGHE